MTQLELLRKGISCQESVSEEKRIISVDHLDNLLDSFLFKQYYSENALFGENSKASYEMVLPDLKPFPMN